MLYLVRHGRPLVDPTVPSSCWALDPRHAAAIDDLGDSLPTGLVWFSSPESKALDTAQRLADGPVSVVPALAEQHRSSHWYDDLADFEAAVRRAFEAPSESAAQGWEPLTATRDRLLPAVRRILDAHTDAVLVGHGTAWTLLVSELTGKPPDLDAWRALRMPDLWVLATP